MLEALLKDILLEDNILMSVNAGAAIIEMRVNKELPFRVSEEWITIGDNNGPCHMHVKKSDVREARFVKEQKENRTSYSVRFLNARGERVFAAFFTKMQDENGNPARERIERYEQLFRKYGSKDAISL